MATGIHGVSWISCAVGNSRDVRIATRIPRSSDEPPVFFDTVPAKRKYTPMERLCHQTLSISSAGTDETYKLTSDTSLELVYPPDDGRYTGGGRVYLEMVMVVSTLSCVDADILLTLYPTQEGQRPQRLKEMCPGCGVSRIGAPIAWSLPASPRFFPSLSSFPLITHVSAQGSVYKVISWIKSVSHSSTPPHALVSPTIDQPASMPLIRRQPAGRTVRSFGILLRLPWHSLQKRLEALSKPTTFNLCATARRSFG